MSAEYNGKLIAELYNTDDEHKATQIADEMVDIGDQTFPRQIYAAYKKFEKTTVSHYFIGDLTRFEKTKDTTEILKDIARTSNRSADVSSLLDFMNEIDYLDADLTQKVELFFWQELTKKEISYYDVGTYCTYLTRAEKITQFEDVLKKAFEDDAVEIEARKSILKHLLKMYGSKYFKYYYDNYDVIVGKRAEVLFVKEITRWNDGIIPKLHDKILKDGSEAGKEVIRKHLEKNQVAEAQQKVKEQRIIEKTYLNGDILADISTLRTKINSKSESDERFGFKFFESIEEIYQQNAAAKTKESFVGCCITLRSVLWRFHKDILSKDLSLTDLQKVLPDAQDTDGTLNKFHYFLFEKALSVDKDLFGLRNVQRLVSQIAHPESEADLVNLLKKENLYPVYAQDNWQELHRMILIRYRDALQKLSTALSEASKPA